MVNGNNNGFYNPNGWSLDVSAFTVLLGEDEEFNYRLMRRSFLECIVGAPVAGLQSYLHSNWRLSEALGPQCSHPYSPHNTPLRNMRLAQAISNERLLLDSQCTPYKVPTSMPTSSFWSLDIRIGTWVVATWLVIGAIIAILVLTDTTWVGASNCAVFMAISILVRLAEPLVVEQATSKASQPSEPNAIYILGRRQSCFVLEGDAQAVLDWTGLGLEPAKSLIALALQALMRLLSLAALLFFFITIPNGTLMDQVAFVILNVLGQINVKVGQHLNAEACFRSLEKKDDSTSARTRTHVYGFLLRRFGDGDWVDDIGLLPKGPAWPIWRKEIIDKKDEDAKELYNRIEKKLREKIPSATSTAVEGKPGTENA